MVTIKTTSNVVNLATFKCAKKAPARRAVATIGAAHALTSLQRARLEAVRLKARCTL